MKRIDLVLAEKKLVASRAKAQELIEKGRVLVNKKPVQKSSVMVTDMDIIEVMEDDLLKFVSRAGIKLDSFLEKTQLKVTGSVWFDIGQSTGGFTECLIKRGAFQVVGIEVGHSQLHEGLKNHPRIQSFENVNVRLIHEKPQLEAELRNKQISKAVIDVSFISLDLVLPSVISIMKAPRQIVALVKPQFELGAEALGRQGVVKSAEAYESLEQKIRVLGAKLGLKTKVYSESDLPGRDGNREFFILLED